MTTAKALGNGVPIGAMGCTEEVAQGFAPGTHASTFGGNPLCCAAAVATLNEILKPGFIKRAAETGAYFAAKLNGLRAKHANIVEVRAAGLMIGIELAKPVAPILNAMLENGVICGPAGPNVLRFLPPLIVTQKDVDHVVTVLDTVLGAA
jgi:acetylornithine/succinyldiaminopimelate/putrescine aminotransferase